MIVLQQHGNKCIANRCDTVNRLVVCGSSRVSGRSAVLAKAICDAYKTDGDNVVLLSLADVQIKPCIGCNECKRNGVISERSESYCVLSDDMADVHEMLKSCEALSVISPVFFSGAPAFFKAFLDRLQPYFWTDRRKGVKRPANLFVVGEGGDPHGFGSLVGEVRSALSVAGFSLETVHDWVGLISEDRILSQVGDVRTSGRVNPACDYTFSSPAGVFPCYNPEVLND